MLSGFSVDRRQPSSDLPSKIVTKPSASGVLSAADNKAVGKSKTGRASRMRKCIVILQRYVTAIADSVTVRLDDVNVGRHLATANLSGAATVTALVLNLDQLVTRS